MHGVILVIHSSLALLAVDTLLSGNRVYGSFLAIGCSGMSGNWVLGHVWRSGDWIHLVKAIKKEHGCTGIRTADLQTVKQECSPLSYGGCCWMPLLFEGSISPCFLPMYIATADNYRLHIFAHLAHEPKSKSPISKSIGNWSI